MSARRLVRVFCVCATALASGCIGIDGVSSRGVVIPNEALTLSRSVAIPFESIIAGAALYMIIDPLAPNWQIEETRYEGGRYLIAMKKKRFTTGGDGEAAQIFYRRAAQIANEQGGSTYRIVEYSEGVESNVLIAQRVAQGVVVVVK
ncbi:MAG: hypothetical protein K8S22_00975 [Betaproteobacteria bacterium]|nr:hypothetical protein [Betaproteobacteria bacterium]